MEQVTDLVCGMKIDRDKAVTTSYKAKTYYFCSEECKNKFEKEPERYLKREDPECY